MATNSLLSEFSMGLQASKGTPITTGFKTALATVSGADVRFDERTARNEHPGPTARATALRAPTARTGFLVPVNATALMRPRFLGRILQGAGFSINSVNNTTHWTHTATITAPASFPWMTVLTKYVGDTTFERRITDVRLSQFQFTADVNAGEVEWQIQGLGLNEGNATGSETKQAEVTDEISAYSGGLEFGIGGVNVASPIRTLACTVANTFDENDKVLFSTNRAGLPQRQMDISGTIGGIDIDYGTFEVYKRIVRGGTSGTAPSLTPVTGALAFTLQSLANISGAAVPFRITFDFEKVQYGLTAPNAQNDEIIRADVTFRMIDDTASPLVLTMVNDVSSYGTT